MIWKKWTTGLIAVALLSACSGQQTKPTTPSAAQTAKSEQKYHFGIVFPTMNGLHFRNQAWGYEDEAKKLGVKVTIVDAGGYQNVEKQLNQIEDFIAAKVDGLIVLAVDASATVGPVEKALSKGIPVINVNVLTNSDKVLSKIISDDCDMGNRQAKMMAEAIGGKGKVAIINGPAGITAANRGKCAEQTLKTFKDVQVVDHRNLPLDPAQAVSAVEDLMKKHPDISGFLSWADTIGVPIAQAVSAAGKAGKIMVTTIDFVNPDNRRMMEQGVIYGTVAQQPVTLGRLGIQTLVQIKEGKSVPKQIFSPVVEITKANLDKVDLSGIFIPNK